MIPHGKVTKSQLDITNKNKEVGPFLAGDHMAAKHINNTNDPQKRKLVLENIFGLFESGRFTQVLLYIL